MDLSVKIDSYDFKLVGDLANLDPGEHQITMMMARAAGWKK